MRNPVINRPAPSRPEKYNLFVSDGLTTVLIQDAHNITSSCSVTHSLQKKRLHCGHFAAASRS